MAFRNALAMSESGGRYDVVNSEGYAGKYQFGADRLADYSAATGRPISMAEFVANPSLQEDVYSWHEADIDQFIRERGLDRYLGQNVGGVTITLDGLRSMAHLGGKGGMAKFLETGGRYNPADSNGTSLSDYGAKFGKSSGGFSTASDEQYSQGPDQLNALAALLERQQPEQPRLTFDNTLDVRNFMTAQPQNQLSRFV